MSSTNFGPQNHPYVSIVEQPARKSLRFRYECEGRVAGSISGSTSTPENRTYPTIRVHNWYQGRGIVIVSCVTKDEPHRPHPHNLIGKETCDRGVCRIEFTSENPIVQFTNLGIQCVKRKELYGSLTTRQQLRVDPFKTGFDHKSKVSSMDLNSVRLCFQVFIEGRDGRVNVPLRPVLSNPIYDKKTMSDLTICKMSHECASVDGGTDMIVLCEKVTRDNVQVRFFETTNDQRVWEAFAIFQHTDVHKQVAINFRTPSYRDRNISEPVQVWVELTRPTDGVSSEAWPFKYLPTDCYGEPDADFLRRKRRRWDENSEAQILLRNLQKQAENAVLRYVDDDDDRYCESGMACGSFIDRGNGGNGHPSFFGDVSRYGAEASPGTLPSNVAHRPRDDSPFVFDDSTTNSTFYHDNRDNEDREMNDYPKSDQTTMTIYHGNFEIPDDVLDAVVGETMNCDTSLNITNLLDSAELAAYATGFTESGNAMDDGFNRKDANGGKNGGVHVGGGNYDSRWAT